MRRRQKFQYTVRDVPAEVDRRLREASRRQHRSLNQTLLDILGRAAGASGSAVYRDLDSFFGSWTADSEVDRALDDQRKIDRKLWR